MSNLFYHRNGVSSEMFFGRKNELEILTSKLISNTPCSMSIVGIRRIGKTSLLQFLMSDNIVKKLADKDVLMIFFDFQKAIGITDSKFLQVLINKVVSETMKYLNHKNDFTKTDLDNEIKYLENLRKKSLSTTDIFELANELFESTLRRTSQILNVSVVLIFDEFEKGVYRLSSDLLSFLRSLPLNYRIGYITSTLKELKDVCKATETSGFYNIFEVLPLGLLDHASCRELVNELRKTSVKIDGEDIENIIEKVGRFPYFIQLACSKIYQTGKITGWEEDFLVSAAPVYSEIFESLDKNDKDIILTISKYKDSMKNTASLNNKGLVLEDGKLFSPIFSKYVLNNYTFSTTTEKDLWDLVSSLEVRLKLFMESILIAKRGPNWIQKVVLKNKQNSNLLKSWIEECNERNEELSIDSATFGTLLRILKVPSEKNSTFIDLNESFKQLSKYHNTNDILESIRKMRNRLNHRKVNESDRPNENELNIISSYCKEIMLKVLNKYI